jgi:hypothetical protein
MYCYYNQLHILISIEMDKKHFESSCQVFNNNSVIKKYDEMIQKQNYVN